MAFARRPEGGYTMNCPKCKRRAEPQERYCSHCHTVFTSDTQEAANLRLRKGTPTRWKVPTLAFIAVLGGAFVQVDAHDVSAEAGSLRASARDTKRAILEWVAEYTGFMPTS